MNEIYITLLVFGTLAVSSGLLILIFEIVSISLYQGPPPHKSEALAFVSCALHGATLVLLISLLCQYKKNRNSTFSQKTNSNSYLIALAGVSWTFSSFITVLEFCLAKNRVIPHSEKQTSRISHSLVMSALIFGLVSIISQCVTLILIASLRRKSNKNQENILEKYTKSTEMSESTCTRPSMSSLQVSQKQLSSMLPAETETSSSKQRYNEVTEEPCLVRSTLRSLISLPKITSQRGRPSNRDNPECHDQMSRLSIISQINAWEASSGDANYTPITDSKINQLAPININTNYRSLETIPASPTENTGSNSQLPSSNPTRKIENTRSFSPANSHPELKRYSRSSTPVDLTDESNIHPLFRADSSNPPPSATPGTVVTAAPGAGQVISDRASIRSLKSKRSGSSLQTTKKKISVG
ncbi:hypothetical protein GcC1_035006 [Golovinomyces cichoracearum]|uniref:Uncharacterized protein n=1 Tax=Golovinomyces cichoracearum TaxID=62708 RepID=A0A420J186_9PEZI|nr:hypothetical protein GcC1_035006 [Golovinomyces cichoracearum]